MKKRIYYIILICFIAVPLFSESDIEYSVGINGGLVPAYGGDLSSTFQQSGSIGVIDGINGINRTQTGVDTERISRLLAGIIGINVNIIFMDYVQLGTGFNFAMNFYGGTGKSIDGAGNLMTTSYSLWYFDIPATVGITIPYWRDTRISLNIGFAFAYGNYSNSFKSSTIDSKASFSGWGFPLLFSLKSDYYITELVAVTAALEYYMGSSGMIESNSDYSIIDFTNMRWTIGISLHINSKIKSKF